MSWSDRTLEAAYTSPSGTRLPFIYTDLSQASSKKAIAFEFPNMDGTYIQDLGISGRSVPLECIFTGDDCDLNADDFMSALSETGVGSLEHPVYGVISVVPFGEIKRLDPRVKGANNVTISVVFRETIVLEEAPDATSTIDAKLSEWQNAYADQFERTTPVATELERKSLADSITGAVKSVRSALTPLYDSFEDIQRGYSAIEQSLLQGLDVLVGEPLILANQVAILVQAPARSSASAFTKLRGYSNLITSLLSSKESFSGTDVNLASSVAGQVRASLSTDFSTQREAVEYATLMLTDFQRYNDWREGQAEQDPDPDPYNALQEVVSLAAKRLIEQGFSLKKEVSLVLTEDRALLDLEYELYKTIDVNTNDLINANGLYGENIIIVPSGKRIVYYV